LKRNFFSIISIELQKTKVRDSLDFSLLCSNLIYFVSKEKPMDKFYYLSSCDTCKRIMKTLELPSSIDLVDIKKTPLSETDLSSLYAHTASYEALLNKRAQKLKEVDKNSLTEEKIKDLLLAHYTFLKRPVLLYNNRLFIGNTTATIKAAKAAIDG